MYNNIFTFKKFKIIIIIISGFILYHLSQKGNLQILKPTLNKDIYDLRINHLKEPFGIDIIGNSFSFLSHEQGPFRAYILSDNKIIQSKKIKLDDSISFTFKKPL